ncbi:hypothetical protein KUTeg_023927 [Tegillarca granosa]|uniref:ELMO domain-containing protein n=1 Tax=Tegillarca granosa TaxID=220873 RepID=A0ABQ9DVU7_TEGGR|nr:hypothetical protein KUTeg_023927 [Tegillarca granosa]
MVIIIVFRFEQSFKVCLCQICGYKRLKAEIEIIRTTKYDSQNEEHEEKLQQLWTLLMPDVKLEKRISKQWTEIGFQGDNPMTDFRGMGMLGLNQLLYFASIYTEKSRNLLSHSKHPKYGYSYAIVSINMTSLLYEILSNGALRTHFYNIKTEKPSLQDFHEVYCYLFLEFDKFWFDEKPKDIMEFGRVRKKFKQEILHRLMSESTTVLKMDISKES